MRKAILSLALFFVTTILGMGITFLSLIILQIVTSQFDRLNRRETPPPANETAVTDRQAETKQLVKDSTVNEELVAAVTTSLAIMLETSASSIVIRDIRRVADTTPVWSKAGIAEQVQNSV